MGRKSQNIGLGRATGENDILRQGLAEFGNGFTGPIDQCTRLAALVMGR